MSIEALSEERRLVVDNVAAAIASADSFRKTELHDPVITDEDVRRVILPFDNERRGFGSRARSYLARKLAEMLTKKVNALTEIKGEENLRGITGGAIITANHYNPTDSTPIRMLAIRHGARRRLHIIVQETNVFMTGTFGFLMKNCNTHPVSRNAEYMVKNLRPALESILRRGDLVLIYPEQEMWFNYKRPRALRDGAYHYAAQFGVPIIPTFTEMITLDGERDADGFLPIKHVLHVMPPIYPDPTLSVRENRVAMQARDLAEKRACYKRIYGISSDLEFSAERDIAGITADGQEIT